MNAAATVVPRTVRPMVAGAWMLLSCALFALMNVLAKYATREVAWHEVALGRSAFGALTIVAFARARNVSLSIENHGAQRRRTAAGICAMAFGFFALSRLPLGDAVTIGNLTPLLVAVASQRTLGERPSSTLGIASVFGFLGVALLAGARVQAADAQIVGVLAAIAGASFSAVAMIYLRKLGGREAPEAVALHFAVGATIAMSACGAVSTVAGGAPLTIPSLRTGLALGAAGLVGGLAQVTMTKAYGLDNAARVGAIGYASVLFSQLLGAGILHEYPSAKQLGGAALVVLSGVALVAGGLLEVRRAGRVLAPALARDRESS